MAVKTPKYGLTQNGRGWVKRIKRGGPPKWICSLKVAPTPAAADAWYELHLADLWTAIPSSPSDGEPITLAYIADAWDAHRRDAGVVSRGRLDECDQHVNEFLDAVGRDKRYDALEDDDFAKAYKAWKKRFGPHRLKNAIKVIRAMFRWASEKPLRLPIPDYGTSFMPPGKAVMRKHKKRQKEKHGLRMFKRDEITKLLTEARTTMRAMILLALNGGFGNTDVAELPLSILDLDSRLLDYSRGKTGAERRVPLWPETIVAVRDAIKHRAGIVARLKSRRRKVYPGAEGLVFITTQGQAFITPRQQRRDRDRVGQRFGELCRRLELQRFGRNFYSLRRTHRTHADAVGDERARDMLMGHVTDEDMGGEYVQEIVIQRLKKITKYVRRKTISAEARVLFGTYKEPKAASPDAQAATVAPAPAHVPAAPSRLGSKYSEG